MKRCAKCKETKPKSSFGARTDQKDGLDYYCRDCKSDNTRRYMEKPGVVEANRARAKRWREENPERARAAHDAWIEKNRARARENHKFRLLRHRYGLSRSEYGNLMRESGGRCELCGSDQRLCVDHCHKSGVVRGLLCLRCNTAIERLEEVPGFTGKAEAYLEKHNAKV